MTQEFAKTLTNYYATVATAYLETASKVYEASMGLATEITKIHPKDFWTVGKQ
jgi:hypothetical protein